MGSEPTTTESATVTDVAGLRYVVRRRLWPWALVRPDIGDSPWAGNHSGTLEMRNEAADLDLAWNVVRLLLRPAELLLAVVLLPVAQGLRWLGVLPWPVQVLETSTGRLVHETALRGRESSGYRITSLREAIEEGLTFAEEPRRAPHRGL